MKPFRPGELIGGRYQVHHVLGGEEGYGGVFSGMGVILVVLDTASNNVMVLKTFQERFLQSKEVRDTFLSEAKAWIALDRHPHIVQAFWAEVIGGRLFVASEYIAQDPLGRNRLLDYLVGRPMSLFQTLTWAIQFCFAMEHALEKGLSCHRDIKPDNIMVTSYRSIKIADFGLAGGVERALRRVSGNSPSQPFHGSGLSLLRTGQGLVCGTPGYIAPEVLAGVGADTRSDVFSFGVCLHQMVSGASHPPGRWTGADAVVVPLVSDHQLAATINKCASRQPEDRYETFTELRIELETIASQNSLDLPRQPSARELTANELSNKGASFNVLERYPEAISCFDQALKLESQFANAWVGKGVANGHLGDTREKLRCVNIALSIDDRNEAAWVNKGEALASLGENERALGCLKKALDVRADYLPALLSMAGVLTESGSPAQALEILDQTLSQLPRDANLWNTVGIAFGRLDEDDKAIECFNHALELSPFSGNTWNNKGCAQAKRGRYQEAIACFEKALEITPGDISALRNKGQALTALDRRLGKKKKHIFGTLTVPELLAQVDKLHAVGRYEDSLSLCEVILASNPTWAPALSRKGIALSGIGKLEDALRYFFKATEIDPKDESAWANMAEVHRRLGRKTDALEAMNRAIQIDPKSPRVLHNKAILFLDIGKQEEAVVILDQMLALSPGDPDAWGLKGEILTQLGRYEEAVVCQDQVINVDPGHARAWLCKGRALTALGRSTEALECTERALALNDREIQSWVLKGQILTLMGQTDEAERCFRKAHGIDSAEPEH